MLTLSAQAKRLDLGGRISAFLGPLRLHRCIECHDLHVLCLRAYVRKEISRADCSWSLAHCGISADLHRRANRMAGAAFSVVYVENLNFKVLPGHDSGCRNMEWRFLSDLAKIFVQPAIGSSAS